MIKVINPGLLTTVQDLGRYNYQSTGMPVAGVMDQYALRLGNILNDNDEGMAGLEITYSGFSCEFLEDTTIALTGADLAYKINGKATDMNTTLFVNKGDRLITTGIVKGVRGYLTLSGGILVNKLLGSRSTYLRGKIGGLEGSKLFAKQVVPCENHPGYLKTKHQVPKDILDCIYCGDHISVVLGPEATDFQQEGLDNFTGSDYKIQGDSDRMGYRLKGANIKHKKAADILSSALTFGSIQVPGNGQPIIMMADRQTTGGYSKIANVSSISRSALAQKGPGEVIRFRVLDVMESQKSLAALEEKIKAWKIGLCETRKQEVKVNLKSRLSIKINGKNYNVRVEEYV